MISLVALGLVTLNFVFHLIYFLLDLGKPFDRCVYQKLQWISDKDINGSKYNFIDNMECYCVVNAEQAGNFHLYFSCEEKGLFGLFGLWLFRQNIKKNLQF
jgi:hypothetical protein